MAKKLTPVSVQNAKPRKNAAGQPVRTEIPDAGKPGLYLIVQPTEKKSWAVRYRHKGTPRKATIDGFLSLALARQQAQVILDAIANGGDPAAQKREAREAKLTGRDDSFASVAERFKKAHLKRLRSGTAMGRMLDVELVAQWGKRNIHEITAKDADTLLDKIVARGSGYTANRVLALGRKLFNWATAPGQGLATSNPFKGIEPKAEEEKRKRVLSPTEIRWFWQACDKLGFPFGPWAKLLLLTAQRRTQVASMRWTQLKGDEWEIPADEVQKGEAHTVPLSDLAMTVVEGLKKKRIKNTRHWVFTTTGETFATGWANAADAIRAKMQEIANEEMGEEVEIPHWRYHDLRRTAATVMQSLGIEKGVVEKVLNHVSGEWAGIVGVYQVDEMQDDKIDALDAWGRFVELAIDAELWAAHQKLVDTGSKDDKRQRRNGFKEAIREGGAKWQVYREQLGAPKLGPQLVSEVA